MNFDGLKLVLCHINPPIPDRSKDWCVHLADDPEDTWHYGYGKDPEEALMDLADKLGSTWSDMHYEHDPVSDPDRLHDYPDSFMEASNG